MYPCYRCSRGDSNCSSTPGHSPLEFETHEFGKHGVCAGVESADDYFAQLCLLAESPVAVLRAARAAGTVSLDGFAAALKRSDRAIEIFSTNEVTMELYLSACRDPATKSWVLAPTSTFTKRCGSSDAKRGAGQPGPHPDATILPPEPE